MKNKKGTAKEDIGGKRKLAKAEARKRAVKNVHKWRRIVGARQMWVGVFIVILLTVVLSYNERISLFDQKISYDFYQLIIQKRSSASIKIISIDEKTTNKYGNYSVWSRSVTAKLLDVLNESKNNEPSVIGIDLDYSEKKDDVGDAALVEACGEYKNVCLSAAALMEKEGKGSKGNTRVDINENALPPETSGIVNIEENGNAADVRLPFDELYQNVTTGIVNNTRNSDDGYVRNVFSSITVGNTKMDGFATSVYKMYMDSSGMEYMLPKLNDDNSFNFTYSKKSQEFSVYSFADVAEGKIAPAAFKDCIVLVGDYTKADNKFNVPNQRETQMHEVELQANILEALLGQRTGVQASKTLMAVFYAIFLALFYIATSYSSDRLTSIIAIVINAFLALLYWRLTFFGYYVNVLLPFIMIVLITIYNLVARYVIAVHNQYAIENVLGKYVDGSVISELGKDGMIEAHIGVVSKDIAVLFVDIRGFTSLSESLHPEQIVEILNDYLSLVAKSVSNHQGTLDKFIGDAAMAVFNSPTDLEDYEYKAVCAALDLRDSASGFNDKYMEKYGRKVTFGIGIQCGDAVIGNIGCETRMDYTAIGDTVNTASRLEGAAAPGQILISSEMATRLEGRIKCKYAGEYELKGKKEAVVAYAVEGKMQLEPAS